MQVLPADNILTKFEISPGKIKVANLKELTGVINCCWVAGAQCGAAWRDPVGGVWFGCGQGKPWQVHSWSSGNSQWFFSFVREMLSILYIWNVKAEFWLVDYFVVFLREREEETPLSSTACSYVSWSFRKSKWQREPLGFFFKGSARMWCAECSVLRSCLQSFSSSCTMAQLPP